MKTVFEIPYVCCMLTDAEFHDILVEMLWELADEERRCSSGN